MTLHELIDHLKMGAPMTKKVVGEVIKHLTRLEAIYAQEDPRGDDTLQCMSQVQAPRGLCEGDQDVPDVRKKRTKS